MIDKLTYTLERLPAKAMQGPRRAIAIQVVEHTSFSGLQWVQEEAEAH